MMAPSSSQQEPEDEARGSTTTSSCCFASLPPELLHIIFSRLPFPLVFQARLVSKPWLAALTSPHFYRLWSSLPSNRSPWFFTHHAHGFVSAYNPFSNLWLNLPVQSHTDHEFNPTLVASSHGLLCFLHHAGSYDTLFLLNPLLKSSVELPRMLTIDSIDHVGLAADREHDSYKIIAYGFPRHNPSLFHAELYDSTLRTWVLLPQPPERLGYKLGFERQFVWWNGLFCILSGDEISNCIITYDINKSRWTTLKSPFNVDTWVDPDYMCLHVIQDRLLVAGSYYSDQVSIWELDPGTLKWIVVAFMPNEYTHKLLGEAAPMDDLNYRVYSDGDGDFLCFSRLLGGKEELLVFYHFGERSWSSMSACSRAQTICCELPNFWGLTFQPSLVAKV